MSSVSYKLLITKQVLDYLANSDPKTHDDLKGYLNVLGIEQWKNDVLSGETSETQAWIEKSSNRTLFSRKIDGSVYGIWELVLAVDVTEYYSLEMGQTNWKSEHFIAPTIIIYSIGNFPGDPKTHLLLQAEDLTFDRAANISESNFQTLSTEIYYNEELYHLTTASLTKILSESQKGLPIYLTPEQAEILGYSNTNPSPVLMSGEAGSGKTTIITHWLLIKYLRDIKRENKILFVTFSPRLVEYTKQTFLKMLPPDKEIKNAKFLTFRELLFEEIIGENNQYLFQKNKEMTLEKFLREYAPTRIHQLDSVLVWDEIRSVIKGNRDTSKKFIDLKSYKELKEEKGQCKTPEDMRNKYYDAALKYQSYLDTEGMWDSIDLAHSCILQMKENPNNYFDWIACDETQDLAPIEIEVLVRLLKDNNIDHIFFTGDVAQVINPSGFTWSKLKNSLWEHHPESGYIRDVWSLKRNFRSSTEIVSLVNQVRMVRKQILNDTRERSIQTSFKSSGIKPMVLREDPLNILGDLTSSPKERLILVKNKSQKEFVENTISELWEQKGTARQATVLTVDEAKGLEWDGILLWNFFHPRHEMISKNEWENVFVKQKRESLYEQVLKGEKSRYGLTYEFNLLHVGLTRARDYLFIFDEDKQLKLLNMDEGMVDYITEIDKEYFSTKWQTKLPNAVESEKTAIKLMDKDNKQAVLLFADAGRSYQNIGELAKAAVCYEKANLFDRAAECYRLLKDIKLEKKLLAMHFELEGEDYKAGQHWQEVAQICTDETNTSYYSLNDAMIYFDNAKKIFERMKQFEMAAKISEQKAKIQKDLSKRLEEKLDAVSNWEKVSNETEIIRILSEVINEAKNVHDEYIMGDLRNLFLGKRLREYSEHLAKMGPGRLQDAIKSMVRAAVEYRIITRGQDLQSRKKIIYLKVQKICIEKVTEWCLSIDKVEEAIGYRKEFLNLILEMDDDTVIGELMIVDWWLETIDILQNRKAIFLLVNEIEEYIEYLESHKETHRAFKFLKQKTSWLRSEGRAEDSINLFSKLAQYYEDNLDYENSTEIWYEVGELQSLSEDDEIVIESTKSFGKAGHNHILLGAYEKADKCFMKGREVGSSELRDSAIGWYCFRKVGLKYWIPGIYFEPKPREELLPYLEKWIDIAAEHFIFDRRKSIRRLKGYIKRMKRPLSQPGHRMSLIRDMWTHYCLALIYYKCLIKRKDLEYIREMGPYFDKVLNQLVLFIESPEIHSDIKSKNIKRVWIEHWENMKEFFEAKILEIKEFIENKGENKEDN